MSTLLPAVSAAAIVLILLISDRGGLGAGNQPGPQHVPVEPVPDIYGCLSDPIKAEELSEAGSTVFERAPRNHRL